MTISEFPNKKSTAGLHIVVATVVIALVLAACSSGSSSKSDSPNADGTPTSLDAAALDVLPSEDITLTDQTVIVRGNAGTTLKSIASNGTTLTLDGSAEGVDRLKPGSVMLLTGITVVKVASVSLSGGDVVIEAEPAEITDLISEGELAWEDVAIGAGEVSTWESREQDLEVTPMEEPAEGEAASEPTSASPSEPVIGNAAFGGVASTFTLPNATEKGGDISLAAGIAGRTLEKGTVGDYSYETKRTRGTDGSNVFHFAVSKQDKKGLNFLATIDATIDPMVIDAELSIHGGILSKSLFYFNNLSGKIKINLDAGTGEDIARFESTLLKLPVSFDFRVPPIYTYGIPFNLSVTGSFVIEPHFTSKNSTIGAEIEVEFGGATGLSFDSGTLTANGDIKGKHVGTPVNSISGIALGAAGFVFAAQFPKVQFGLGTSSKLMGGPYVSHIASMGVAIAPAAGVIAPCKQFTFVQVFKAGIGIQIPGIKIPDLKKIDFGKNTNTGYTPHIDACKPK